jgi:hypothetical protein
MLVSVAMSSKLDKAMDKALIAVMLREAIKWFHEARRHPENEDKELYSLARECANGAFKNHALMIAIPRREIVARKFMEACQKAFAFEVPKAAAEKEITLVH